MKNLFKFTLFAFSAAALVNCTNDITDDGSVDNGNHFKTVSLTVEASTDSDDSRALFNIGEDGKAVGMMWNTDKGEQNIAVVELWDDECKSGPSAELAKGHNRVREGVYNSDKTADKNDGNAIFDTELIDDGEEHDNYSYVVAYPYSAFSKFSENAVEMTLPANQTPAKVGDFYNVDPAATLMFSVDYNGLEGSGEGFYTDRAYQLHLKFKHAVGYGKIRISNLALLSKDANFEENGLSGTLEAMPWDEYIDYVEITSNDEGQYLAGTFKLNYPALNNSTEKDAEEYSKAYTVVKGENKVKLNVKDLQISAEKANTDEGVTLYFAALPVTLSNFTVTVVTTEGRTFVKDIQNASKPLDFLRATVRAFNVNFSGVESEENSYARVYELVNAFPAHNPSQPTEFIITAIGTSNGEKVAHIMRRDLQNDDVHKSAEFAVNDKFSEIYYKSENNAGTATAYTWYYNNNYITHETREWNGVVNYYLTYDNGSLKRTNGTNTSNTWTLSSNGYITGSNGGYLTYTYEEKWAAPAPGQGIDKPSIYADRGYRFVNADFSVTEDEGPQTEDCTEYMQVTTDELPLGEDARPIIITAVKDGVTYYLNNSKAFAFDTAEVAQSYVNEGQEVGAKEKQDDEIGTRTYMYLPKSYYEWSTSYSTTGQNAVFFKDPAAGSGEERYYIGQAGDGSIAQAKYATIYRIEAAGDTAGNYKLRIADGNYLTMNKDGKLEKANTAPSDVIFRFYAAKDDVLAREEFEKDLANSGKDVYVRVSNFELNKEYIIALPSGDNLYAMPNNSFTYSGATAVNNLLENGFEKNEDLSKISVVKDGGKNYLFKIITSPDNGKFSYNNLVWITSDNNSSYHWNYNNGVVRDYSATQTTSNHCSFIITPNNNGFQIISANILTSKISEVTIGSATYSSKPCFGQGTWNATTFYIYEKQE